MSEKFKNQKVSEKAKNAKCQKLKVSETESVRKRQKRKVALSRDGIRKFGYYFNIDFIYIFFQ